MRKEFLGFYEPTIDEVNTVWSNAYFVFDTNALLNLYRYTESTRNDFLLVLNKLKNRLFLPNQIGWEYHKNRLNIINELENSYDEIFNSIKKICDNNIQGELNKYLKHPTIDTNALKKAHEKYLANIKDKLTNQKKQHPNFKEKDYVLDNITTLYENKVGRAYTRKELNNIYVEGEERFKHKIPPGYKDAESKKSRTQQEIYGDLIFWKQILDFAKKEAKAIILITDDRKEDWWTKEQGKTIRPREELIKEFFDITGLRILIYNAENFLYYAKERKLVDEIKDDSINEVKEVRKSEETNNVFYNTFKSLLGNTASYGSVMDNNAFKTIWDNAASYGSVMNNDAFKTIWDNAASYGSVMNNNAFKTIWDNAASYGSILDNNAFKTILDNAALYENIMNNNPNYPKQLNNINKISEDIKPVEKIEIEKNINENDSSSKSEILNDEHANNEHNVSEKPLIKGKSKSQQKPSKPRKKNN